MAPSATLPASRRERRSAELRERLFRAALQLFAQKGYSETTVEDITNAADVGKGTFFNYFPSKEHILAAFGRLQMDKVQAAVDEAPATKLPIREILRQLAIEAVSEPARNPAMVRALLQANLSSAPVRETMREIHTKATALLSQIVEVGQKRGEIQKDLNAAELAQTLRQSLLGAMLIWSLYGDGTLQSRIETVLAVLWNGMAARSGSLENSSSSNEGKFS
ncbi:MAG TPA: TetR/AcrR family transcriptional regulator [Candidatus Acidoferrum sp.]